MPIQNSIIHPKDNISKSGHAQIPTSRRIQPKIPICPRTCEVAFQIMICRDFGVDCGSLEGSVGSFDDCWVDFSGACLDELDVLIEESSVMFIRLSVAADVRCLIQGRAVRSGLIYCSSSCARLLFFFSWLPLCLCRLVSSSSSKLVLTASSFFSNFPRFLSCK